MLPKSVEKKKPQTISKSCKLICKVSKVSKLYRKTSYKAASFSLQEAPQKQHEHVLPADSLISLSSDSFQATSALLLMTARPLHVIVQLMSARVF